MDSTLQASVTYRRQKRKMQPDRQIDFDARRMMTSLEKQISELKLEMQRRSQDFLKEASTRDNAYVHVRVELDELNDRVEKLTKLTELIDPDNFADVFENGGTDMGSEDSTSEFDEENFKPPMLKRTTTSRFHRSDLMVGQIEAMDDMFSGISTDLMDNIMHDSLETRRIKAISEFCDVDFETAQYYLRKHDFNPEPVVQEIDDLKTKKYNTVFCITTSFVLFAIIYVVGFGYLATFLNNHGKTEWKVSYRNTTNYPEPLPMIILPIQGISSEFITPYQIRIKKRVGNTLEEMVLCGPQEYPDNCWANTNNALVCTDDISVEHFVDDPDFSWGICRKGDNTTRHSCPKEYPIMCANMKANMGREPYCGFMGECDIAFFQGPRTCPDGRNLASVYDYPTNCSVIQISEDEGRKPPHFRVTDEVQVYRYETFLFIVPPNKTNLSTTSDIYSVSFRLKFKSSDMNKTTPYLLKYIMGYLNEMANDTLDQIVKYVYEDVMSKIEELPMGSESKVSLSPTITIDRHGKEERKPIMVTSLHTNTYMWYHTAISVQLMQDRVTISEENFPTNFMQDFIGPAAGFTCFVLRMQSAFLLFILTGIYIPCCGGKHFFGWTINMFSADFRKKMIHYGKIYDPKFADEAEGIDMLRARTVTWPTNEKEESQTTFHFKPGD